jgi:hypothetical protein
MNSGGPTPSKLAAVGQALTIMSIRRATVSNSGARDQPRRRKRRVLLSHEERQKIEGEFVLTGGHFGFYGMNHGLRGEKKRSSRRERRR